MKYLTIGTLWKDEHSYARDFIEFHRAAGVEHFVIFDREYFKLKKMFNGEKDIEIFYYPEGPENFHQAAFGALIRHNQGKTKWLSLLDADQALVPVQTNDVKEILKNYEDFASLQINWKAFGSGGQETRLPGSVYERFTRCAKSQSIFNDQTQFICQPHRTLPITLEEPHYPMLPEGEISVNTNKQEIDAIKSHPFNPNRPKIFNTPPLHDILYVNHYTNKSREEFIEKRNKGRADIYGMQQALEQFDEYEAECNEDIDLRALEIWKKV